jgi:NADH-quinone oxidoreductase subunit E
MANPSAVQDAQVLSQEQEVGIKERLGSVLSSYQGSDEELIPILQQVQQVFGYVPEITIREIARFLHLPEITVFGVATFYAQFKLAPTGRNIVKVCRGTACHVRNGAQLLKELEKQLGIKPGETTPDLKYGLETVACFGACALSPIVVVNDKVYGRMTPQKVKDILD